MLLPQQRQKLFHSLFLLTLLLRHCASFSHRLIQPQITKSRKIPTRLAIGNLPWPPLSRTCGRTTTTTAIYAMPTADVVARGLGYVIGAGSLLLYTPIAIRLLRQRSADGLTESTWWLKLASYTCTDIYCFNNGYPVSTYVETLVITVEAAVVLGLVAYFQRRNTAFDVKFGAGIALYVVVSVWGLTLAPTSVVALGQAGTAILNTVALVPQFLLNFRTQSSGDYSPITASLAAGGCLIRIFTTVQLAGSDPMLLFSFGLAFVVNSALLGQILWYGVFAEGRPISELLLADCVGDHRNNNVNNNYVVDPEEEIITMEEERQQELLIRARMPSSTTSP